MSLALAILIVAAVASIAFATWVFVQELREDDDVKEW